MLLESAEKELERLTVRRIEEVHNLAEIPLVVNEVASKGIEVSFRLKVGVEGAQVEEVAKRDTQFMKHLEHFRWSGPRVLVIV